MWNEQNIGGWNNMQGDYNYLYGTGKCKNTCKTLFPTLKETGFRKACKQLCKTNCNRKSKCPGAFIPTREGVIGIASGAGLGLTTLDSQDNAIIDTTAVNKTGNRSNTGLYVGIAVVGVLIIGGLAYKAFKK